MEIKVADIDLNQTFDQYLSFEKDFFILPPKVAVSSELLNLFKKWNIKGCSLVELRSVIEVKKRVSTTNFFISYEEKKKVYEKVFSHFEKILRVFYGDMLGRGVGHIKQIREESDNVISLLLTDPDIFKFNVMLYLSRIKNNYNFTKTSFAMSLLTIIVGYGLKLDKSKLKILFECALFSDVGMLKVPLKIMLKKEPLTPKEKEIVENHCVDSYKLISQNMKLPKFYSIVALCHHEHIDGTGFPRRMKGEQIPIFSKIICIIQEFVALFLGQLKKKDASFNQSIKILVALSEKRFEKSLVNYFISLFSFYPLTSLVKLSSGEVAIVVKANLDDLFFPLVKLVRNVKGDFLKKKESFSVDLKKMNLTITDEFIDEKFNKRVLDVLF